MATLIVSLPGRMYMRTQAIFPVLATLSILLLAAAGCVTEPAAHQAPVPEATPPPAGTTPAMPPETGTPVTPAETPQATFSPVTSTEEINLHFIDVAFGGGNLFLERLPLSAKRTTVSLNAGRPSDREAVEAFIRKFNALSQSNRLFENTKTGTSGDIRIKFLPPEGLRAIDTTSEPGWLNREFPCGDSTCAKVKGYDIYLNDQMEGDQRTHYLLRALLYALGFKGDSYRYPDSIFFHAGNNVTTLSFIDEKAVQVMYGLGMDNGLTVEDVKKVLFFR
ncbi:MAG: hypothetical protein QXL43_03060 [Methanolinea sp.]